jgi:exopolysaccharide biosynthesis protein
VVTDISEIRNVRLDSGIAYYQYRTNGARPIIAHVIECDRTVAGNAVRLVKGEDHAIGLERLAEMSRRFDSRSNHVLYGLVNGNFWKAVSNLMIGPCVIDGEVVQLSRHKKWSSALFDVRNAMYIDTFSLSGVVTVGQKRFPIESVNDRRGTGVVVHNIFGGNVVPFLSQKYIEKAFNEAVRDSSADVDDSTEVELTNEMLKAEIAAQQRERDIEFPMVKIRVRYLRTPSINTTIACEVLSVDTGSVNMPLRGAVISLPKTLLGSNRPRVRDTITLRYETNILRQVKFMNAVSGTPRLVRNGIARSEAQNEGSTASRFVHHTLARTAIGMSADNKKIYLVAVPPDRPENGTQGASLQQMSELMALVGCHNALNLDGGGSTGMTVQNDHVFYDGTDPQTRRIGLGVGVVKLAKILRTTGY